MKPSTVTRGGWCRCAKGRRFGWWLANTLLARGDRVVATSRRVGALAELLEEYPERLWFYPLDITDACRVRRVAFDAFTAHCRIDVVINNAGSGLVGAVEECSDDQINRLVNTNLIGSIHVIRAALPHLRSQGGGRIMQMSSMAGQIGLPARSVYAATKWGIEGFVESLIPEVTSFGVRLILVEPGSARTAFDRDAIHATPMDAYTRTLVGEMRRAGSAAVDLGDREKMARAMIAAAEMEDPPRRLVLGTDAYALVHKTLVERMAELESQKGTASVTDADNYGH